MPSRSNKVKDPFWVSYADLMTTMFFVMFALFVLVFSLQKKVIINLEQKEEENIEMYADLIAKEEINKKLIENIKSKNDSLRGKAEEIEKIREINEATQELAEEEFFEYNVICKRFELNKEVLFDVNSATIPEDVKPFLVDAGKKIVEIIPYLVNY